MNPLIYSLLSAFALHQAAQPPLHRTATRHTVTKAVNPPPAAPAQPPPPEAHVALYHYGDPQMKPIPCAPLRLCEILLEPGERIPLGQEPVLGDSKHWTYIPRVYGHGADLRTSIVVKLTDDEVYGFTNDLLITTDRHDYRLTLLASPTDYMSQVSFDYPEEEQARSLAAYRTILSYEPEDPSKSKAVSDDGSDRDYGYTIHLGKHTPASMAPLKAYHTDSKTVLVFAETLANHTIPTPQLAGPAGCENIIYHHPDDFHWVFDGVIDQLELIAGMGKHAQRVTIRRNGAPGPFTCGEQAKDLTATTKHKPFHFFARLFS